MEATSLEGRKGRRVLQHRWYTAQGGEESFFSTSRTAMFPWTRIQCRAGQLCSDRCRNTAESALAEPLTGGRATRASSHAEKQKHRQSSLPSIHIWE